MRSFAAHISNQQLNSIEVNRELLDAGRSHDDSEGAPSTLLAST
jgi:hypothetical protein